MQPLRLLPDTKRWPDDVHLSLMHADVNADRDFRKPSVQEGPDGLGAGLAVGHAARADVDPETAGLPI